MILCALVSDLHANSTVGLCPARVVKDDGGIYLPSREQGWIAECWSDFWQQVDNRKRETGAQVVTVVAGDGPDVNQHAKTQLIEPENAAIVADITVDVMTEPRIVSDWLIWLRGTEAHGGGAGQLEELVAKLMKANGPRPDRFSWWQWQAELEEVKLDAAHHPQTNSGLPYGQGAACNRQAFRVWTDYHRMGLEPPQIVLRGHVHWYDEGHFEETRCWYLPPWQLSTAYGYRRGQGARIEPVGGLLFELEKGEYKCRVIRYPPPRGRVWTLPKTIL